MNKGKGGKLRDTRQGQERWVLDARNRKKRCSRKWTAQSLMVKRLLFFSLHFVNVDKRVWLSLKQNKTNLEASSVMLNRFSSVQNITRWGEWLEKLGFFSLLFLFDFVNEWMSCRGTSVKDCCNFLYSLICSVSHSLCAQDWRMKY